MISPTQRSVYANIFRYFSVCLWKIPNYKKKICLHWPIQTLSEVERIQGISVQVLWSLLPEGLLRDSFRDQSLLPGILFKFIYTKFNFNRRACENEAENLAERKKSSLCHLNCTPRAQPPAQFSVIFDDFFSRLWRCRLHKESYRSSVTLKG